MQLVNSCWTCGTTVLANFRAVTMHSDDMLAPYDGNGSLQNAPCLRQGHSVRFSVSGGYTTRDARCARLQQKAPGSTTPRLPETYSVRPVTVDTNMFWASS